MANILVDRKPSLETLERLGVMDWPIWTKEVSTFPWTYDSAETCYLIEGKVTVTPDGGEPVTVGKGSLVTFPAGLKCTWQVTEPVRKHYHLD